MIYKYMNIITIFLCEYFKTTILSTISEVDFALKIWISSCTVQSEYVQYTYSIYIIIHKYTSMYKRTYILYIHTVYSNIHIYMYTVHTYNSI